MFEGGPGTLIQAYAALMIGKPDNWTVSSILLSLIAFAISIMENRRNETFRSGLGKMKLTLKEHWLNFFICITEIASFIMVAAIFGVAMKRDW